MTEFAKQMIAARKRVAELDEVDGQKPRDPMTICGALEAGLRHPDTGAQYDALVMLEDVTGFDVLAKEK